MFPDTFTAKVLRFTRKYLIVDRVGKLMDSKEPFMVEWDGEGWVLTTVGKEK